MGNMLPNLLNTISYGSFILIKSWIIVLHKNIGMEPDPDNLNCNDQSDDISKTQKTNTKNLHRNMEIKKFRFVLSIQNLHLS